MKQTAVEWFNEEILIYLNFDQRLYLKKIFEQAKAMEQNQIEEAFNFGVYDGGGIIKKYKMSGEQYYNENFKSE